MNQRPRPAAAGEATTATSHTGTTTPRTPTAHAGAASNVTNSPPATPSSNLKDLSPYVQPSEVLYLPRGPIFTNKEFIAKAAYRYVSVRVARVYVWMVAMSCRLGAILSCNLVANGSSTGLFNIYFFFFLLPLVILCF